MAASKRNTKKALVKIFKNEHRFFRDKKHQTLDSLQQGCIGFIQKRDPVYEYAHHLGFYYNISSNDVKLYKANYFFFSRLDFEHF